MPNVSFKNSALSALAIAVIAASFSISPVHARGAGGEREGQIKIVKTDRGCVYSQGVVRNTKCGEKKVKNPWKIKLPKLKTLRNKNN